jgi:hypothetical protein
MLRMSATLPSFETLGVTPLTLLASAGGLAAAFKRPFRFRVLSAVFELASSFGGGRDKNGLKSHGENLKIFL